MCVPGCSNAHQPSPAVNTHTVSPRFPCKACDSENMHVRKHLMLFGKQHDNCHMLGEISCIRMRPGAAFYPGRKYGCEKVWGHPEWQIATYPHGNYHLGFIARHSSFVLRQTRTEKITTSWVRWGTHTHTHTRTHTHTHTHAHTHTHTHIPPNQKAVKM